MTTLGTAFDPRANSIGAMRLIAAGFVVVGHAVTFGGYGADPTMLLTHNQIATGRWPVDVFFVMSGFLLTRSVSTSSLAFYARSRALRIFPAYWVVLLICGLAVPMAYGIGPDIKYVVRGVPLIFGIRDHIPGVFEGNPEHYINSALWTLPWEMDCYISLAVLAALKLLKPWLIAAIFGALYLGLAATVFQATGLTDGRVIGSPFRLAAFFYAGATAYCFRDAIPHSRAVFGLAIAALAAAVAAGVVLLPVGGGAFYLAAPVLLTYVVLYLACGATLRHVNNRTDLSYGIYIYGALVLQVLVTLGLGAPHLSYIAYLGLASAITAALAFASWNLIERPALRLKHAALWGAPTQETRVA